MKNTTLDREVRRQRALQRLDSSDPRCARCGENDPHCLERHHIAGRAYDDRTTIVCRNCHRKLSDLQCDHPAQIGDPPSLNEHVGHFLLGLADLFALLIEMLREFGLALIKMARANAEKDIGA